MRRFWRHQEQYNHATEEFTAAPIRLADRAPAWPGWLQGDVKGCDAFDPPPAGTPRPTAPKAMCGPPDEPSAASTRASLADLLQPAIYGALLDYEATRTRFGCSLEAALACADELLAARVNLSGVESL